MSKTGNVLTVYRARRRLVWLWFMGCIPPVSVVIARSILEHYKPHTQDAWEWFLPTILPTFMLIWSVFFSGSRPVEAAERSAFWLSWWASLFYLVLVLGALVGDLFNTKTPIEMLKMSNFWLGSAQGGVAMAIGMFFVRSATGERDDGAEDGEEAGRAPPGESVSGTQPTG